VNGLRAQHDCPWWSVFTPNNVSAKIIVVPHHIWIASVKLLFHLILEIADSNSSQKFDVFVVLARNHTVE